MDRIECKGFNVVWGVRYLPAMGGKKTARTASKISELHMASEGRGG
jgi:hypothetical protein